MNYIFKKTLYFYANRGWFLDSLISLTLLFSTIYINLFDLLMSESTKHLFIEALTSLNGFFGIFVGFLLMTFPLLYAVKPIKGTNLEKIRNGGTYKKMLYSILTTSLLLLFTILILIFSTLITTYLQFYSIIFLLSFVFLRILKSIFYLFFILMIEN